MWRLQHVDIYLLWHMRPLEGQEDLDPEMHHIETEDKLCGVYRVGPGPKRPVPAYSHNPVP